MFVIRYLWSVIGPDKPVQSSQYLYPTDCNIFLLIGSFFAQERRNFAQTVAEFQISACAMPQSGNLTPCND